MCFVTETSCRFITTSLGGRRSPRPWSSFLAPFSNPYFDMSRLLALPDDLVAQRICPCVCPLTAATLACVCSEVPKVRSFSRSGARGTPALNCAFSRAPAARAPRPLVRHMARRLEPMARQNDRAGLHLSRVDACEKGRERRRPSCCTITQLSFRTFSLQVCDPASDVAIPACTWAVGWWRQKAHAGLRVWGRPALRIAS